MTRNDHGRRVTFVVTAARRAAQRGQGLSQLAAKVNMPCKTLRKYLMRHGADDVVPVLVARDS